MLIWSDGVGRTTTTLQIAQDHVFDPYGPLPSLGHLKPEFASDDIRLPVFAIVYGILANTQLVKPADEPKSWLDLVDPRWKGKILSDDFRALGGGGVLFFVLEDRFGSDFHEKLAKQDLKFSREIPANERRVARSEFPLYLPVSLTSVPELKGLPVNSWRRRKGYPMSAMTSHCSRMHRTPTRHGCSWSTTLARRCSRV